MPITLTNQTDQGFGNVTSSSLSLANHTVGSGSNRALLVTVNWKNGNLRSINSVVWDSAGANESLTEIGTGYEESNDSASHAFILTAPTTGTNKSVTVTWSGTLPGDGALICAYSLEGVDQTTPVRDEGGAFNSSSAVYSTVLTTLAGDFIAAHAGVQSTEDGPASWTNSSITMTEVYDGVPGGEGSLSAAYGSATGVSTTVQVNWAGSDQGSFQAVAIAPSTGYGNTVNTVGSLGAVNTVNGANISLVNTV